MTIITHTPSELHVAVIMGGLSSERDVSLSSAHPIIETLQASGYHVTAIDMQQDIAQQLLNIHADVVFNALHGTYGEDGCIQGLLEILGIPYTHSSVLASALAMNKLYSRMLFEHAGIRCAQGGTYTKDTLLAGDVMPRPYVIKPIADGSSVGVYIIEEHTPLPFSATQWPYAEEEALVERYIPGREFSVAVLQDKALGVVEICPHEGFYDYTHKYTEGKTEHLMPAPIDDNLRHTLCDMAEKAHRVLGCRGVSRADFRYDENGTQECYLLEVNNQPGMTPLSLVPEIAAYAGISFAQLLHILIEEALCRKM